jgi:low temperature requirement protein LtrA
MILMLSFIIVLSMMLFALYMIATRERASEGLTRESGGTKIFPLLYADISSLMALGLACSLKDRYIDLLLVVSISLYVVALTLTYATSKDP